MKKRVTYKEAIRKHSFDNRHVCVSVCEWDNSERNRVRPNDIVANTLNKLLSLEGLVRVIGAKVTGCVSTGRRGHYKLDLGELDDREQYQFWKGALGSKSYQPIFEVLDRDALITWIANSFADPRVYENLTDMTSPAAVNYCLDRAMNSSDASFVMYGGSFELGKLVVFAHQSKMREIAETLVDNCKQSDQFATYASGPFEI